MSPLAATTMIFVALQHAALRLPPAKVIADTYPVLTWAILWEQALGRAPYPLPRRAALR